MTTLLYSPGACSLAPHIVLEWIGKPYIAQRVQIGSAELRAHNPSGAVPVLIEEDGWTLTQCGAILHYLGYKYREADLIGEQHDREQAELTRWICYFTGDLHPAFFPVFMTQRYTKAVDEQSLQQVKGAGVDLVGKKLEVLERHMGGREYILSKRSIVDAYAFPMLRWSEGTIENFANRYPACSGLQQRLNNCNHVKRVLSAEA